LTFIFSIHRKKVGTNCFNTRALPLPTLSYANGVAGVWDCFLYDYLNVIYLCSLTSRSPNQ